MSSSAGSDSDHIYSSSLQHPVQAFVLIIL